MQDNVASINIPNMPELPDDVWPKSTVWAVTAQHHVTKERKTRMVRFTGPFPIKAEMDYYCPPDVCVITEMQPFPAAWNE